MKEYSYDQLIHAAWRALVEEYDFNPAEELLVEAVRRGIAEGLVDDDLYNNYLRTPTKRMIEYFSEKDVKRQKVIFREMAVGEKLATMDNLYKQALKTLGKN